MIWRYFALIGVPWTSTGIMFECVSLFVERKQVKRFAPPPVRLQIEKQIESQECASNTEKVWQLTGNSETPDIKICVSFIPLLFTPAMNFIWVLQCGSVGNGLYNSLITDCAHKFEYESAKIYLYS